MRGLGMGMGLGRLGRLSQRSQHSRLLEVSWGGMHGGKGFVMAKSEHGFQAQEVGPAKRRGWQRV